MGADGAVTYIKVKRDYDRVLELLKPFWQFTSMNGAAHWAEEGNDRWFDENPSICAPRYLIVTGCETLNQTTQIFDSRSNYVKNHCHS